MTHPRGAILFIILVLARQGYLQDEAGFETTTTFENVTTELTEPTSTTEPTVTTISDIKQSDAVIEFAPATLLLKPSSSLFSSQKPSQGAPTKWKNPPGGTAYNSSAAIAKPAFQVSILSNANRTSNTSQVSSEKVTGETSNSGIQGSELSSASKEDEKKSPEAAGFVIIVGGSESQKSQSGALNGSAQVVSTVPSVQYGSNSNVYSSSYTSSSSQGSSSSGSKLSSGQNTGESQTSKPETNWVEVQYVKGENSPDPGVHSGAATQSSQQNAPADSQPTSSNGAVAVSSGQVYSGSSGTQSSRLPIDVLQELCRYLQKNGQGQWGNTPCVVKSQTNFPQYSTQAKWSSNIQTPSVQSWPESVTHNSYSGVDSSTEVPGFHTPPATAAKFPPFSVPTLGSNQIQTEYIKYPSVQIGSPSGYDFTAFNSGGQRPISGGFTFVGTSIPNENQLASGFGTQFNGAFRPLVQSNYGPYFIPRRPVNGFNASWSYPVDNNLATLSISQKPEGLSPNSYGGYVSGMNGNYAGVSSSTNSFSGQSGQFGTTGFNGGSDQSMEFQYKPIPTITQPQQIPTNWLGGQQGLVVGNNNVKPTFQGGTYGGTRPTVQQAYYTTNVAQHRPTNMAAQTLSDIKVSQYRPLPSQNGPHGVVVNCTGQPTNVHNGPEEFSTLSYINSNRPQTTTWNGGTTSTQFITASTGGNYNSPLTAPERPNGPIESEVAGSTESPLVQQSQPINSTPTPVPTVLTYPNIPWSAPKPGGFIGTQSSFQQKEVTRPQYLYPQSMHNGPDNNVPSSGIYGSPQIQGNIGSTLNTNSQNSALGTQQGGSVFSFSVNSSPQGYENSGTYEFTNRPQFPLHSSNTPENTNQFVVSRPLQPPGRPMLSGSLEIVGNAGTLQSNTANSGMYNLPLVQPLPPTGTYGGKKPSLMIQQIGSQEFNHGNYVTVPPATTTSERDKPQNVQQNIPVTGKPHGVPLGPRPNENLPPQTQTQNNFGETTPEMETSYVNTPKYEETTLPAESSTYGLPPPSVSLSGISSLATTGNYRPANPSENISPIAIPQLAGFANFQKPPYGQWVSSANPQFVSRPGNKVPPNVQSGYSITTSGTGMETAGSHLSTVTSQSHKPNLVSGYDVPQNVLPGREPPVQGNELLPAKELEGVGGNFFNIPNGNSYELFFVPGNCPLFHLHNAGDTNQPARYASLVTPSYRFRKGGDAASTQRVKNWDTKVAYGTGGQSSYNAKQTNQMTRVSGSSMSSVDSHQLKGSEYQNQETMNQIKKPKSAVSEAMKNEFGRRNKIRNIKRREFIRTPTHTSDNFPGSTPINDGQMIINRRAQESQRPLFMNDKIELGLSRFWSGKDVPDNSRFVHRGATKAAGTHHEITNDGFNNQEAHQQRQRPTRRIASRESKRDRRHNNYRIATCNSEVNMPDSMIRDAGNFRSQQHTGHVHSFIENSRGFDDKKYGQVEEATRHSVHGKKLYNEFQSGLRHSNDDQIHTGEMEQLNVGLTLEQQRSSRYGRNIKDLGNFRSSDPIVNSQEWQHYYTNPQSGSSNFDFLHENSEFKPIFDLRTDSPVNGEDSQIINESLEKDIVEDVNKGENEFGHKINGRQSRAIAGKLFSDQADWKGMHSMKSAKIAAGDYSLTRALPSLFNSGVPLRKQGVLQPYNGFGTHMKGGIKSNNPEGHGTLDVTFNRLNDKLGASEELRAVYDNSQPEIVDGYPSAPAPTGAIIPPNFGGWVGLPGQTSTTALFGPPASFPNFQPIDPSLGTPPPFANTVNNPQSGTPGQPNRPIPGSGLFSLIGSGFLLEPGVGGRPGTVFITTAGTPLNTTSPSSTAEHDFNHGEETSSFQNPPAQPALSPPANSFGMPESPPETNNISGTFESPPLTETNNNNEVTPETSAGTSCINANGVVVCGTPVSNSTKEQLLGAELETPPQRVPTDSSGSDDIIMVTVTSIWPLTKEQILYLIQTNSNRTDGDNIQIILVEPEESRMSQTEIQVGSKEATPAPDAQSLTRHGEDHSEDVTPTVESSPEDAGGPPFWEVVIGGQANELLTPLPPGSPDPSASTAFQGGPTETTVGKPDASPDAIIFTDE